MLGKMTTNIQQIDILLEVVQKSTGKDLTGYCRSVLSRRISERLARLEMGVESYVSLCRSDETECTKLADSVAIHVSSFFRNPIVFEILAQSVLPRLMEQKNEIRVWSAGCSAGEEPYSIAILIQEELKRIRRTDLQSMIFATDIDPEILKAARTACYSRESLNHTKLGWVDRWFSPVEGGFQLCTDIRRMVYFSADDLLSTKIGAPAESIYGSFDLILCRNVLIYFTEENQQKITQRLYDALASGGTLVLGDCEALHGDVKSQFKTVDAKNKIYQKQGG